MPRLQCNSIDGVLVVGQDTIYTHTHCINEDKLVRTYMLEFAQFHWNVSRGIKTMNLSDSIQSTTYTFGQWFCDAACFVTQLFILIFAEILPAISLLWQEIYYGALLILPLLCVEGASSTGLPNRTADHGITIRLLVHLQLTHNTESSVILKGRQHAQVCICRKWSSMSFQDVQLSRGWWLSLGHSSLSPPLWLNCW